MPSLNGYLDVILNPALENFQSESIQATPRTEEASKEIETQFLDALDNAMDLTDMPEIDKLSKTDDKSEKKDENTFQNPLSLQSFGPPIGIEIENFNYSLI